MVDAGWMDLNNRSKVYSYEEPHQKILESILNATLDSLRAYKMIK